MTTLLFTALLVLLALLVFVSVQQVTVYEYERGLRYHRGRFTGVVHPGSYWVHRLFTHIVRVDTRPMLLTVPGQEVIAADGVGLKLTALAQYRITDPEQVMHAIADYRQALYAIVQLALRQIVADRPAESIVAGRDEIDARLQELAAPQAAAFGVELTEARIKDVMFPGDLKKVFSQVVRARQEGLAALERARGETAALRNLSNAAALLAQRPALLQLRMLQSLGAEGGNTVVLGLGGAPGIVPVPPAGASPAGQPPNGD